MNYQNLPSKWKEKLAEYIRKEFNEERLELLCTDFQYNLLLNFEDGSFAVFQYAFYILDRETNEFAVFTEHCGYHIFPLLGTSLELLESKWTDVGTPE
jgi:hypothetical protein